MKFLYRKNIKFLLAVVLLVFVIFLSSRGADSPVKSGVFGLTSPFLKAFRIFFGGAQGFFQFLSSIGELKDENEKLIKENLESTAEVARLRDAERENNILRRELDLLPRGKYTLESAFVIAQNNLEAGSSIVIDKGRTSGLKENMPVIVSSSILVGRVREIFSNTARVDLITNRESAVNGEVLESGVKGIVKGSYGLGVMMDMISQTEVIKEGDTIVSSGLGGGFPRGLLIGKIGQVGQSQDMLFQQASVISPIDIFSLRVVSVIKNQ